MNPADVAVEKCVSPCEHSMAIAVPLSLRRSFMGDHVASSQRHGHADPYATTPADSFFSFSA